MDPFEISPTAPSRLDGYFFEQKKRSIAGDVAAGGAMATSVGVGGMAGYKAGQHVATQMPIPHRVAVEAHNRKWGLKSTPKDFSPVSYSDYTRNLGREQRVRASVDRRKAAIEEAAKANKRSIGPQSKAGRERKALYEKEKRISDRQKRRFGGVERARGRVEKALAAPKVARGMRIGGGIAGAGTIAAGLYAAGRPRQKRENVDFSAVDNLQELAFGKALFNTLIKRPAKYASAVGQNIYHGARGVAGPLDPKAPGYLSSMLGRKMYQHRKPLLAGGAVGGLGMGAGYAYSQNKQRNFSAMDNYQALATGVPLTEFMVHPGQKKKEALEMLKKHLIGHEGPGVIQSSPKGGPADGQTQILYGSGEDVTEFMRGGKFFRKMTEERARRILSQGGAPGDQKMARKWLAHQKARSAGLGKKDAAKFVRASKRGKTGGPLSDSVRKELRQDLSALDNLQDLVEFGFFKAAKEAGKAFGKSRKEDKIKDILKRHRRGEQLSSQEEKLLAAHKSKITDRQKLAKMTSSRDRWKKGALASGGALAATGAAAGGYAAGRKKK